jgi:3-dehydroquinate synthase
VLEGLEEFREHLGGRLTVMMLGEIGRGVDVHELDTEVLGRCIDRLCGTA